MIPDIGPFIKFLVFCAAVIGAAIAFCVVWAFPIIKAFLNL